MKREFLIDRQGRTFVLYAGLLDEAHRRGLKSIRTQVVQSPSSENGNVAICSAEVEIESGVYTGIGDASPENVGRTVSPHFIRMAETRAKARALRDAINVGAVAVEELGDLDEPGPAPAAEVRRGSPTPDPFGDADRGSEQRPPAADGRGAPTPIRRPAAEGERGDSATAAQVRAIYLIGRDQHGLSDESIDERSVGLFGAAPSELTKRQASQLITTLKGGAQPAAS